MKTNKQKNKNKPEEQPTRKRQVNQHLQQSTKENLNQRENITIRKSQRKQTNNEEDYWIDNIPPELTDRNYSPLNSNNQQTTNKDNQEEITVIQEAPISQLPQENSDDILQFVSPPVTATIPTTTPPHPLSP